MSAIEPFLPQIDALGERALLLRWPDRINAGINADVHACADALEAAAPGWIEDIVPAYSSLAVVLDPVLCAAQRVTPAAARDWLEGWLAGSRSSRAGAESRLLEIPVHYGGDDGPDLGAVAAAAGMSEAQVVARHSGVVYRVGLLGFAPGFPYLIGLDPVLATPRLARPRTTVPAGSVGIAGDQTGVYPQSSPGGWRLVGRTRLQLFDPMRQPPCLLRPGDQVRFVAAAAGDADGATR